MKNSLLQQRLILIITGLSLEFLYLLYFLRNFSLLENYKSLSDLGKLSSHSGEGFWTFIFTISLLFLIFGIAWYVIRNNTDKISLWIIGGFSLLFSLTLTFVYPLTAIDIYNYIAQSTILTVYHQNPIFVPAIAYPDEPIVALTGDWGKYGSPYGPLGIFFNAIPSYFVSANLFANLISLKLMFSLFIITTMYVVYKIVQLNKPTMAVSAALFVAWNPLLLFEVSVNGHNDIIMMMLAMWAMLLMLKGYYKMGTVFIVLSALIKYATFIFLPVFIIYALLHLPTLKKKVTYIVSTTIAMTILLVVVYSPFWEGIATLQRTFIENRMHVHSFSIFFGSIFRDITFNESLQFGRIIFLSIYGYLLVKLIKHKISLPQLCFWICFSFLLFAVGNLKIWYAIWPVILAAAIPRLLERGMATVFAYCATFSVIIFSFIFMWWDNNPTNYAILNISAYLVTFLPAILFFIGAYLFSNKKVVNKNKRLLND